MADPYARAGEAADRIADLTGRASHDALVVLGSGWGPAADAFGEPVAAFAMTRIPGFQAPVADGHRGEIRSCLLGDVSVLLLLGRTHLYEGRGLDPVVHPVRTAAAAGVRLAVLTNANGSLRADWAVGRPVLLADHLALTATSPLVGPAVHRPHRRLVPAASGPGQGGRPVAGRRGLRMAARPAL